MQTSLTIDIQKAPTSRAPEIDWNDLPFGVVHTDHFFMARYRNGHWEQARILPFQNLSLSPFALCLHYGQTIFEGLKAFRMDDGKISIFRPEKNHERFVRSAERMCMPAVPEEYFLDGLHRLIELESQWVPEPPMCLYIRPFMIASEPRIKVKVSDEYLFLIVLSPVGPYYSEPLKVKVETEFVRAAEGGVGYAKCGGNYGASFYPFKKAGEAGYDQVIWTDSRKNAFLEESGTMNIMLVIDDELVTPPTSDSILAGVTRDSILQLAPRLGLKPVERRVDIAELEQLLQNGRLREAFGAGTAAMVAPIREIGINGRDYPVPVESDAYMFKAKALLEDMRYGRKPDEFGWNRVIEG